MPSKADEDKIAKTFARLYPVKSMTGIYRDYIQSTDLFNLQRYEGLFSSKLFKLNMTNDESWEFLKKFGLMKNQSGSVKSKLSDLNKGNLLNPNDTSNIFELLINPVVFSNAESEEKLLLIFNVLKLVEASPTHVSFNNVLLMVWYMLKTALFYSNFEDIHRRIGQILERKTSMIVNATIESRDGETSGNADEWDVTYMLNTWLTALRSPDLKNFIILGENGHMNILKAVIEQWEKNSNPITRRQRKSNYSPKKRYASQINESQVLEPESYGSLYKLKKRGDAENFEPTSWNDLNIKYIFEGDLLTYTVSFDNNWNMVFKQGSDTLRTNETSTLNKRAIVTMENSNSLINESEFINIMTNISEIGVIMNYRTNNEQDVLADISCLDFEVNYLHKDGKNVIPTPIYSGEFVAGYQGEDECVDTVKSLKGLGQVLLEYSPFIPSISEFVNTQKSTNANQDEEWTGRENFGTNNDPAKPFNFKPIVMDCMNLNMGVSIEYLLKKVQANYMKFLYKELENCIRSRINKKPKRFDVPIEILLKVLGAGLTDCVSNNAGPIIEYYIGGQKFEKSLIGTDYAKSIRAIFEDILAESKKSVPKKMKIIFNIDPDRIAGVAGLVNMTSDKPELNLRKCVIKSIVNKGGNQGHSNDKEIVYSLGDNYIQSQDETSSIKNFVFQFDKMV